jgi:glycine betaine/proline transport system permease protein
MTKPALEDALHETLQAKSAELAAERRAQVERFVRTSPDYYERQFTRIGSSSRFTPTFNLFAGLFGPIWFAARGLWNWAVPFLIVETIAFV